MTLTSSAKPSSSSPEARDQTAGVMLRQARERLGLSIADIATVTRIPRNMLEHLERDRFDEYAASVFTRGHLMNFAREVRLDPERVLSAYERQLSQSTIVGSTTRRPARQGGEHESTLMSAAARLPQITAPIARHLSAAVAPAAAVAAPAAPPVAAPARPVAPRAATEPRKLNRIAESVRPVHMVSILLLLCALFAGAFFLNGSSATAQASASFEAPPEDAWSLEKEAASQSQWSLEQPAASPAAPAQKRDAP